MSEIQDATTAANAAAPAPAPIAQPQQQPAQQQQQQQQQAVPSQQQQPQQTSDQSSNGASQAQAQAAAATAAAAVGVPAATHNGNTTTAANQAGDQSLVCMWQGCSERCPTPEALYVSCIYFSFLFCCCCSLRSRLESHSRHRVLLPVKTAVDHNPIKNSLLQLRLTTARNTSASAMSVARALITLTSPASGEAAVQRRSSVTTSPLISVSTFP